MATIATNSLDHVALWVSDRKPLTELLCEHLGMHVIERSDDFTLIGADAREGKLTLFRAEGPRDPDVLERVVLRVSDLDAALARLPGDLELQRRDGRIDFEGPDRLGLGLIEAEGLDYDLDHIVLGVPEPDATARHLAELGFGRRNGRLGVADRGLVLEAGTGGNSERPLLNHLALLVDSAEGVRREAEERGIEIEKFVDAENTLAVFLRGPDRILIEYVEHKPGFSLS
jgi:catechol 2,3-dioxygenase-like lactoylglutathione lyase family enzyme